MTGIRVAASPLIAILFASSVAIADDAPLRHANALVIFYRTRHFEASVTEADISVGDKQYCELSNHDVCAVIISPGEVTFKVATPLWFGHLDFPITLEQGKTYYIQVTQKSGMPTAGAIPYLLSNRDMPAKSICDMGNCAIVMPEDAAKADLQAEKLFPSIPFNW